MQAQPPAGLCLNLQASRLRGFIDPLFFCLKFLLFPSTRSGRARAPTFWPAESRQRLAKEGCAPLWDSPLGGRARVACGHNRARGSDGTPSRVARQELPRRLAKAFARKSRNGTLSHAHGAHDRRTFPDGERWGARGAQPPQQARMTGKRSPNGERGGQGGAKPPTPNKRWRCGGRGERARARGLPQVEHRSSSRASGEEFGQIRIPRQRRLGGFPKGGRPAPPLWSGDSQGGWKLPCACLLPTFLQGQKSRGPRAARARRRENLKF